MYVNTQDGKGVVIKEEGTPVVIKSVYTKGEFLAKLPKGVVRQIQSAAVTNDTINAGVFHLGMMTTEVLDLNDPPTWFVDFLDELPSVTDLTQNQVNNFLER